MAKVYLLVNNNPPLRTIERVFNTEDEAKEYLKSHVKVEITSRGGTYASLGGNYTVETFDISDLISEKLKEQAAAQVKEEAPVEDDGMLLHLTVQSESFPYTKTYGVVVDKDGVVQGCTCPAFIYQGGHCKHMFSVKWAYNILIQKHVDAQKDKWTVSQRPEFTSSPSTRFFEGVNKYAPLYEDAQKSSEVNDRGGVEWSVPAIPAEENDGLIHLTVESQSYPYNKTYGVSVSKEGMVLGCTCPDYEHRASKDGSACKHMYRVSRFPDAFIEKELMQFWV